MGTHEQALGATDEWYARSTRPTICTGGFST